MQMMMMQVVIDGTCLLQIIEMIYDPKKFFVVAACSSKENVMQIKIYWFIVF